MKVFLVRTYYDGETTKHPTSTKIETCDRRFAAKTFEDAEIMAKKVMDEDETISFICEESPHIHLPPVVLLCNICKKSIAYFMNEDGSRSIKPCYCEILPMKMIFNKEKAMADARASYLISKQVEQQEPIYWPNEEGKRTWGAVVDAVLNCFQKG